MEGSASDFRSCTPTHMLLPTYLLLGERVVSLGNKGMEEAKHMAYRTGCCQQPYLSVVKLRSLAPQPFLDVREGVISDHFFDMEFCRKKASLKQVKSPKLLGPACQEGGAGQG